MPSLPIHVLQGTPKEATAYVCQIRAMRRASTGVRNSLDNALLKQAYSWNEFTASLGDYKDKFTKGLRGYTDEFTKGLSNSDPLSYGLAGAGGGALIAALNELRRKKKHRNYSNILLGAGIGGGVGAGGAYLNKELGLADVFDNANLGGAATPAPDTSKPPTLDEDTVIGGPGSATATGEDPVDKPVKLKPGDVTEMHPSPNLKFEPPTIGENGEVIPGKQISGDTSLKLPWWEGVKSELGDDPVDWAGNMLLAPGQGAIDITNWLKNRIPSFSLPGLPEGAVGGVHYEGPDVVEDGLLSNVPDIPASPVLAGGLASGIGGAVRRKGTKMLDNIEQGRATQASQEAIASSAPDAYKHQAVKTPTNHIAVGGASKIDSVEHAEAVKHWLKTTDPDDIIKVLNDTEIEFQIPGKRHIDEHLMNREVLRTMLGGAEMKVPVTGAARQPVPQQQPLNPWKSTDPLVPAKKVKGQFDSIFSGDIKKPSRVATQHAQGLGRMTKPNSWLKGRFARALTTLPFGIGTAAEIYEQLQTRGK